jgi:hypothetical protein
VSKSGDFLTALCGDLVPLRHYNSPLPIACRLVIGPRLGGRGRIAPHKPRTLFRGHPNRSHRENYQSQERACRNRRVQGQIGPAKSVFGKQRRNHVVSNHSRQPWTAWPNQWLARLSQLGFLKRICDWPSWLTLPSTKSQFDPPRQCPCETSHDLSESSQCPGWREKQEN